jgi:putative Holliday junction resolvase
MRIVCLDIGTKRIGVAASDPLGITAQPQGVLARKGGESDFERIAEICRQREAELLLIGMPLDAEGDEGAQAEKVKRYAVRLEAYLKSHGLDLRLELWDERYSTAEAEARLISADVSRTKRKRVIDKMAAVVILEDYLSTINASPSNDEGTRG